MKFSFSFVLLSAFALLTITAASTAPEAEWPQWRGPLSKAAEAHSDGNKEELIVAEINYGVG